MGQDANVNIRGHLALINRNKNRFIICGMLNNVPYVIAFFNVIGGEQHPSLMLDINRWYYAKKLLSALPSVFVMNSDGQTIAIDAVHKCIEFAKKDYKGIIQYHLTDANALTTNVDAIFEDADNKFPPIYIQVSQDDETKFVPTKLKVFPTIFHQGFAICMMDSIEKVFHMSIIDKTSGLMGITEPHEMKRVMHLQNVWPELGIESTLKDKQLYVYCRLLKGTTLPADNCFIKVHRNFGGTDLAVNVTGLLSTSDQS